MVANAERFGFNDPNGKRPAAFLGSIGVAKSGVQLGDGVTGCNTDLVGTELESSLDRCSLVPLTWGEQSMPLSTEGDKKMSAPASRRVVSTGVVLLVMSFSTTRLPKGDASVGDVSRRTFSASEPNVKHETSFVETVLCQVGDTLGDDENAARLERVILILGQGKPAGEELAAAASACLAELEFKTLASGQDSFSLSTKVQSALQWSSESSSLTLSKDGSQSTSASEKKYGTSPFRQVWTIPQPFLHRKQTGKLISKNNHEKGICAPGSTKDSSSSSTSPS